MVPANFNFSFRTVSSNQSLALQPCYAFTGDGDRPCHVGYPSLSYALLSPYKYTVYDAVWWSTKWSWSKVDVEAPYVYVTRASTPTHFLDDTWVEVARYAEHTSHVGSDGGGYGVWHYILPGTSQTVNIGKSIRFLSKSAALEWAKKHYPRDTKMACMEFGHDSCNVHDDRTLCPAARAQNLNSVIVRKIDSTHCHVSGSTSDILELILCPAVDLPELLTACPPQVEYRLADRRRACTCNSTGEVLACYENGDTGSYAMTTDYGTRVVLMVAIECFALLLPFVLLMGAATVARRALRRGLEASRLARHKVLLDEPIEAGKENE